MYLHPISDNGQKKKTRKSAKELAAHLQTLLTSLEDIVFEIDGNQTFKNVWVSDETVLFMPKEQFVGKKVADVMGPQSHIFTDPVNEVIRTGEVHEIVYKHLDKDINKWYKLKIKPVIKAPELADYVLVISIQDITQQRLAELVLQETKEQLELNNQLLDVSQKLSQTAGWELSLLTRKIFWTQQAYLLFDVNSSFEPTLINTLAFFTKESKKLLNEHHKHAIHQKTTYDLELKIITANGVNKWVRAIGVPVTKNGEVIMIRGALMDITLKKENEIALIKAKDLAESASKAKSDFLSIMSHEIRTPLNGIIGIANLLKLNHTVDQKEYIHDLIFSADHLLQLINNVLDLAKVENNKLELQLREVNLLQLIKDIEKQFEPSIQKKGIQLKNLIGDDIPEKIVVDPIRFGQILNNLISNAVKFTDEGEITLSINLVSIKEEEVTIRFSLKDTGIGIPEDMHEAIFQSFKQIDQESYRKYDSTGLGLAIAQKLAILQNSRILLKSEPGIGSEFYFELACNLVKDQAVSLSTVKLPRLTNIENKLAGLRILVVEDNRINLLIAQKQLEHFNVQPDCVLSGKEALKLLKERDYDVVLLDLHMPEMDGYILASILRKQYPNIHIIIFTADIMPEVKQRLAKMNIYDILNKPFAPKTIFEMLLKVMKIKNE